MKIGQWIKRSQGTDPKWHHIESVVADDAITSCGRRMRNETGAFELSDVEPLTRMIGQPQLCKRCGQG